LLQSGVLVLGQILLHQLREQLRFDEGHQSHHTSLTDYGIDGTGRSSGWKLFTPGRGVAFHWQQAVDLKQLGGVDLKFRARSGHAN
jgi:hypothetical protein